MFYHYLTVTVVHYVLIIMNTFGNYNEKELLVKLVFSRGNFEYYSTITREG